MSTYRVRLRQRPREVQGFQEQTLDARRTFWRDLQRERRAPNLEGGMPRSPIEKVLALNAELDEATIRDVEEFVRTDLKGKLQESMDWKMGTRSARVEAIAIEGYGSIDLGVLLSGFVAEALEEALGELVSESFAELFNLPETIFRGELLPMVKGSDRESKGEKGVKLAAGATLLSAGLLLCGGGVYFFHDLSERWSDVAKAYGDLSAQQKSIIETLKASAEKKEDGREERADAYAKRVVDTASTLVQRKLGQGRPAATNICETLRPILAANQMRRVIIEADPAGGESRPRTPEVAGQTASTRPKTNH